jgi:hypothetical protein
MKSPGFRVKTTISGDFNNHKTKNKVINTDAYSFSGATQYCPSSPVLGSHQF